MAAIGAQFLAPGRPPAGPPRRAARGRRRGRRLPHRQPVRAADFGEFRDGLDHQTTVADDALGKLGLTQDNGVLYYLWTLTWGLGWVPALRGARGAVAAVVRRAPAGRGARPGADPLPALHGLAEALLRPLADPGLPARVPAGRLRRCSSAADWACAPRARAARRRSWSLATVALCGQGLAYSLHIDQVLSPRRHAQPDPRLAGRARAACARRSSSSRSCPTAGRRTSATPSDRHRQRQPLGEVPDGALDDRHDGTPLPPPGRIVNIEDYERTLRPELIDHYEEAATATSSPARPSAGARRPSPRWCRGRSPTTTSSRRAERRLPRLAVRQGAGPGRLQLRLVVRLLPARVPPPGTGHDGLPAQGPRVRGDILMGG